MVNNRIRCFLFDTSQSATLQLFSLGIWKRELDKDLKVMKIFKKIVFSVIIGMIFNAVIFDCYRYYSKVEYIKSIANLCKKYWPYGVGGWVILLILLVCLIIENMFQYQKFKSKVILLKVFFKSIIGETILFIIFVLKSNRLNNGWELWLNILYCTIIAFLILMLFQHTTNSYNSNCNFQKKDERKSSKLSHYSNLKNVVKIIFNKILLYSKKVIIVVINNEYVNKRLIIALILSIVGAIIISLWYSTNFDNFQNSINKFLNLQLKISNRALQFSSFIFACILDVIPVIFIFINLYKTKKLRQKAFNTIDSSECMSLKLKIEKKYFQMISLAICFLGLGCILFSIITWKSAQVLTLSMQIRLWFVIFGISVLIVLLLSLLLDWLKKDNYEQNNLPRTTIFIGFIGTLIAALLR